MPLKSDAFAKKRVKPTLEGITFEGLTRMALS